MAQQVKAFVVISEFLGSVSRPNMVERKIWFLKYVLYINLGVFIKGRKGGGKEGKEKYEIIFLF